MKYLLPYIVILAAGCASRPAVEKQAGVNREELSAQKLLSEASVEEFGCDIGCEDTVYLAKKAGFDYVKVVDGCLARDKKSLHILFWLTANAGFDAASAQGHATITGAILRRLGDSCFGDCLANEPDEVRERVHEDILYDAGYDYGCENVLKETISKYPVTLKDYKPHEEKAPDEEPDEEDNE